MLNLKIEHLSARSIRGKISSYLLNIYSQQKQYILDLPMKRHEMADYLNIPRPSLSREMALMRNDDLIDFNGAQVTLKNIRALEKSLY